MTDSPRARSGRTRARTRSSSPRSDGITARATQRAAAGPIASRCRQRVEGLIERPAGPAVVAKRATDSDAGDLATFEKHRMQTEAALSAQIAKTAALAAQLAAQARPRDMRARLS